MPSQRVFLSAVSGQFKACRDALASDLRAIGCEVRVQEDFQQGPRTLIERLAEYVAQCDKVIALIGNAYGAEAKAAGLLDGKPSRSYTQWEYYFAIGEQLLGQPGAQKDLHVYVASEHYLREHAVEQSEEHAQRQREFMQFLRDSGKHRASFDGVDQLCRLVLRDGWQMQDRPVPLQPPPLQLPARALAGQHFGRKPLLAQLIERLKRRENTDIWGPAGMGKTALAAEAIFAVVANGAQLAASPYPHGVVVLDLYRMKLASPDPAWSHLADAFDRSIPVHLSARERAMRACQGRRALVVVEGAEEAGSGAALQELLGVLAPETVRLVLTRDKRQASTARPLTVEAELSREEALELLRELAPQATEATLEAVHKRLGGHPLALTWAGSQLAAGEESPQAFVAALGEARLPWLNEPGYESHTLAWLYQRNVVRLPADARRVLAGAGMLAYEPLPLSAAQAMLEAFAPAGGDAERIPREADTTTREALRQLVRYGLLRLNGGVEEQWQFTHALTHQFAAADGDPTVLAGLARWVGHEFDAAATAARQSGDVDWLQRVINHIAALPPADPQAQALAGFFHNLRHEGQDTLEALGRLDLRAVASRADQAWLQAAPDYAKAAPDWQHEEKVMYDTAGDIDMAAGKLAAARKTYEKGFAIAERLAKADPSNSRWQRDLFSSYNSLGRVQRAAGDLAAARTAYEQSLAIAERLAEGEPSNSERQFDLSIANRVLGDLELASGDLENAGKAYEQALRIATRLVELDQNNTTWQWELAAVYERLGEVQKDMGQFDAARRRLAQNLIILERLVEADPSNRLWQCDLSISSMKLGDVQQTTGDLAAARATYEQGLAILERLSDAEPSNKEWQRHLSIGYYTMGLALARDNKPGEALAQWRKTLAISECLAKQDPSNALWKSDLEGVRKMIALLEG